MLWSKIKKMFSGKNKRLKGKIEQSIQKGETTKTLLLKRQEDLKKQIAVCEKTLRENVADKRLTLRTVNRKRRLENNLKQIVYYLTKLDKNMDKLREYQNNAETKKRAKKASKKEITKKRKGDSQKDMDNILNIIMAISDDIQRTLLDSDDEELAENLKIHQNSLEQNSLIASSTYCKDPPKENNELQLAEELGILEEATGTEKAIVHV